MKYSFGRTSAPQALIRGARRTIHCWPSRCLLLFSIVLWGDECIGRAQTQEQSKRPDAEVEALKVAIGDPSVYVSLYATELLAIRGSGGSITIQPETLRAWLSSSDEALRVRAINALDCECGDYLNAMALALHDSSEEVRRVAAKHLLRRATRASADTSLAVKTVLELGVSDSNFGGFGTVGEVGFWSALAPDISDGLIVSVQQEALKYLGAEDESVRSRAYSLLVKIGPPPHSWRFIEPGLRNSGTVYQAIVLIPRCVPESLDTARQLLGALGKLDEHTVTRIFAALSDIPQLSSALSAAAIPLLDSSHPMVVDAALRALESTSLPDLEMRCVRIVSACDNPILGDTALTKLLRFQPMSKASITQLVDGLGSEHDAFAIEALTSSGMGAVTPLLHALELEKTRSAAAETLLQICRKWPPAINVVATRARDRNTDVCLSLLEVLERLGESASSAIPTIQQLLQDRNATVRAKALECVLGIGSFPQTMARSSTDLLEDSNAEVRANAVLVLAKCGDEKAAPRILSLLRDESPLVRIAALQAIAESTAGQIAAKEILALRLDKERSVRVALCRVLPRFAADPEVMSTLFELSQCDERRVASAARDSCLLMSPGMLFGVLTEPQVVTDAAKRARDELVDELVDADPFPAVTVEGAHKVVKMCCSRIQDKNDPARTSYIRLIGCLGANGLEAMPTLLDLIHSENAESAEAAIDSLAAVDPSSPKTTAALAQCLGDRERSICLGAMNGLESRLDDLPRFAGSLVPLVLDRDELVSRRAEAILRKAIGREGFPFEALGAALKCESEGSQKLLALLGDARGTCPSPLLHGTADSIIRYSQCLSDPNDRGRAVCVAYLYGYRP